MCQDWYIVISHNEQKVCEFSHREARKACAIHTHALPKRTDFLNLFPRKLTLVAREPFTEIIAVWPVVSSLTSIEKLFVSMKSFQCSKGSAFTILFVSTMNVNDFSHYISYSAHSRIQIAGMNVNANPACVDEWLAALNSLSN